MSIRLMNPTVARDIKPGGKIEVFNEWYWVRYINYHGSQITLRLQPEDEPLSPFLRKRPRCGDSTRRSND